MPVAASRARAKRLNERNRTGQARGGRSRRRPSADRGALSLLSKRGDAAGRGKSGAANSAAGGAEGGASIVDGCDGTPATTVRRSLAAASGRTGASDPAGDSLSGQRDVR